jgi:hypothetical protein
MPDTGKLPRIYRMRRLRNSRLLATRSPDDCVGTEVDDSPGPRKARSQRGSKDSPPGSLHSRNGHNGASH